jgi:colanic acid/amylovoran biosynthesis glycosyltransferase
VSRLHLFSDVAPLDDNERAIANMAEPMSKRIVAYLIPEFPGQTHIWMWREIACLREWGVEVKMHSTRCPQDHERARHAFASDPEVLATQYLAPISIGTMISAAFWLAARPLRTIRAAKMAINLPVDREGGKRPATIKLLLPAAILARRLIGQQAAHLHVHSAASSAVVAMLAHALGGPAYSLTLNADLGGWGGALFEKFERSAFTIAITRKLIDEVNRDLPPLSPGKLLLGRIGVDTRVNKPDPSIERRGIVTVARLHFSKGHDTLIRAVGLLRDRGAATTLRIAGAGPQKDELEALVRELKLGDMVTFLGSIGDAAVVQELQRAQVFALASHNEPLGVAYMEAMACGTPTIGTAAGGVGEIITNEADGLLVPPQNAAALADAIERVLGDASLGERLSTAGRQKIIDQFDSRIGAKTLYERVFGSLEGVAP